MSPNIIENLFRVSFFHLQYFLYKKRLRIYAEKIFLQMTFFNMSTN